MWDGPCPMSQIQGIVACVDRGHLATRMPQRYVPVRGAECPRSEECFRNMNCLTWTGKYASAFENTASTPETNSSSGPPTMPYICPGSNVSATGRPAEPC